MANVEDAPLPIEFSAEGLVDLASDALGGFVLFATDDYFAEKENLLKTSAPVFIPDKYTDKGKWMDGWESQRRRAPGHDWAVIRLGLGGSIAGVVVDTTHFRGNAPAECQLEAVELDPSATVSAALGEAGYEVVLPRSKLEPNTRNVFLLNLSRRFTHLKLRIYPDGGVARLRVLGRVLPAPELFLRPGDLDLGAVENGGIVVKVSDRFFGPPSNLLLPGRGVNMGDGWETARRRSPGTDWAVIALGRAGVVARIELDTHFFKGNAPQAVHMEAFDARGWSEERLIESLDDHGPWRNFLSKTALEPHRRHVLFPEAIGPVSHVRVHIHPHGGVNRLRLFGRALDPPGVVNRLEGLNAAAADAGIEGLRALNGSRAWARAVLAARPFRNAAELFVAADTAWWTLSEADWLEAFADHPRLGQTQAAPTQSADSHRWSSSEQGAAVASAQAAVLARLAEDNEAYFRKHGFIFICFASGKTAEEMSSILEARLGNDRRVELGLAAIEQAKITRRRLEKWLLAAS